MHYFENTSTLHQYSEVPNIHPTPTPSQPALVIFLEIFHRNCPNFDLKIGFSRFSRRLSIKLLVASLRLFQTHLYTLKNNLPPPIAKYPFIRHLKSMHAYAYMCTCSYGREGQTTLQVIAIVIALVLIKCVSFIYALLLPSKHKQNDNKYCHSKKLMAGLTFLFAPAKW